MTTSPDVVRDKARLAEVGVLLEGVNEDQRALYDERLDLWKRLAAAGVPRAELAELARARPGALKTALGADRRRESATADG